ncbi:diguanylate cyclase (GGDEF)-like protein [Rhodoblastus acidophilus]|uniref:putative bifunctional diguanylate cyclase/phosphodiesterase n=1 Tax=Rhodoblastus acidophilus TaxID=1074 RepID=UPI002224A6DB|nr:diguanylate cyclase (GGDEF)-like protein [Rhodoblastus acidophilus]
MAEEGDAFSAASGSGRDTPGAGLAFNAVCALCVAAPLLVGRYGWSADLAAAFFLIAMALDAAPLVKATLPDHWGVWSKAVVAFATGAMAFVCVGPSLSADMGAVGALGAVGQAALSMESEKPEPLARWRGALAVAPLAAGLLLRHTPDALIALTGLAALGVAFHQLSLRVRRVAQIEAEADGRVVSALNGVSQCFGLFGADQLCLSGNADFLRLFKLTLAEARGRSLPSLMTTSLALPLKQPEDVEKLLALAPLARKRKARQKLRVELASDRLLEFAFAPTIDGFSLQVEDVTSRRAEELRAERVAHTDDVTGMANRAAFRDLLIQAGAAAADNPFAIFMIDLDRFKQVNDTMGHAAGDKLLERVAKRLRDVAAEGDEVARLGGDEFIVLAHMDRDAAGLFAARIVEALSEPYQIEGAKLMIGASVGVALAPEDSCDASDLMRAADMALYAAKDGGRGGWRSFSNDMAEQARLRQQIEQDLRVGIFRNELEVHYQPIISFAKRRICCCEALVRWRHPTQGMISPGVFIPIAEESGLVIPLGEYVLRQSCEDAKSWPHSVRVAVNFSAHQFARGDLAETVRRVLHETRFPPSRLEAEITETALMSDADNVLATLDELRKMGVRVALDDFGAGYSSLAYLSRFRPDKVKIDQCFVREMGKNAAALAIIKAVRALARELHIDMLVEGVETPEQLEILRANGADEAQGFLFSRARPANEIARLVADPTQLPRARKLNNPDDAPWTQSYERVDPNVVRHRGPVA